MAIHVPCTSKKLGVTGAFEQIAALCAKEVTPSGIPCCGMPPTLRWLVSITSDMHHAPPFSCIADRVM